MDRLSICYSYLFVWFCCCLFGWLAFGIVLGFFAPLMLQLSFKKIVTGRLLPAVPFRRMCNDASQSSG